MTARSRKLLGLVLILGFLTFYVWAAATIGGLLPDHPAIWLVYYAVVGTAWGLPLIPLLSWMDKGR